MEGESVYRLVPPPVEAPTKPPLYRSKHPGAVSPGTVPCSALGAKTVRAAATMGPGSGELLVDPGRFLLAHEKEPVLPQPCKPSTQKLRLKDAVPKRSERPVMGLQSGHDFVAGNVKGAAATAPRHKAQEQMSYLDKPWFGECPPYLQRRVREIEAERERAAHEQQADELPAQADPDVMQTLAGEELAALVTHLKLKWQSLNEAYLKLPCVLDTPSKRRRKEEMEAQMGEIERDMRALEHARVVHITAD